MSNAIAFLSEGGGGVGLRPFPIIGDNMAPTIRRGDVAMVLPADAYSGEGIYVLENGLGPGLYRVGPGGLTIMVVARQSG